MQLVANGPDIPDALLQAHEEGRVVFFCGAGISYPAGLPGFKGLVDAIYRLVGTAPTEIEQEAYTRNQFDATLDLLERRLPGRRRAVRRALAEALQPKLRRKGARDTHAALLQLSRSREGALRLVTTNFDRIFARLTARAKPTVPAYSAPMLPIPKNSRWNGIVYLHGLLPTDPDESALNRLVLTSGDFGLAYLTERWAARFVAELFRNYVVCFVGYSISDPVLRYMMDALAADRMLGEVTPSAYAFGDSSPGQESRKNVEWEAKGVVPILYEVPNGTADHTALHRTLRAWAETYRDGALGKERIVVEYALTRPSASTRQDNFVGRMVWALSHDSGLPAKRFADFEPVPSLDWLDALSEDRYRHGDLARFGVQSHGEMDKLSFSLLRRPAPYSRAPWMTLVSAGGVNSQWDDVMFHLARWLVRHLDDPALILWLGQHGGLLHDRLIWLVSEKLDEFQRLEQESNTEALARIRSQSPKGIPGPLLRIVWRLFLTGRVKSGPREVDLYRWKSQLQRDGLTPTLRFELRKLLSPKVSLRKPFLWPGQDTETDGPGRLKRLVDWEMVLTADHVQSSLRDLANADHWRRALPALLDDFQQLLRDALDLQRELRGSAERDDLSFWDLPSISPHWQNLSLHDWVALIELTRDAWLAVREFDPARATRVAQEWFAMPYPTFKRLALFAASHDRCIEPDQWVRWLMEDGGWWQWSANTKRESLRLLVRQGRYLLPEARGLFEASILRGPPRELYPNDIEPDVWQNLVDRSVWLHLAKLMSSGADLSETAAQALGALESANPDWHLADDERDEFSHWVSGTGLPDVGNLYRRISRSPRKRDELVAWLRQSQPSSSPFFEDTWRDTCRDRFFHCALALCDLANEGIWVAGRWGEAMQAWSEDRLALRSWRFVAPMVQTMPDEVLKDILPSLTWWLETVSKSLDRHENIFLDLCRRVLAIADQDGPDTDQFVNRALDHPIGRVTQALLNLWFSRKPNDGDQLPTELEPFFTQLCDRAVARFRHGRVLLASRLIALFRVDQSWTEAHLLPMFDWTADVLEAQAAWQGFLWSPRLYGPLLIAIKVQLLDTARHYAELGDHAQQFAAFLTYTALDPVDGYTVPDLRASLGALPQVGLQESAQALVQALEGSGEQREEYWTSHIQPFWQDIWPKARQLASNSIAQSLARLSIAARGRFPEALATVLDWLQPIEYPHFVVNALQESGLCKKSPEPALSLLDAIISDQPWPPRGLSQCLAEIAHARPALSQDHRYRRLEEYARRRGV